MGMFTDERAQSQRLVRRADVVEHIAEGLQPRHGRGFCRLRELIRVDAFRKFGQNRGDLAEPAGMTRIPDKVDGRGFRRRYANGAAQCIELELIKPYYTSSELFRHFGSRKHAHWIIYTDSSFSNPRTIRPYPNIKKHLDKFRSVITSSNHPYGLHRSRDERFFKEEMLVSIRKCGVPTFTYTDFDCYVSQTFNVIRSGRVNMKYLCGLLNSRLVAFWLKRRGKMQGHQFQIDKEPLLAIPLTLGSKAEQAGIVDGVQRTLAAKHRDADADVTALEREIDKLVYALYGIGSDETTLVEAETKGLFPDSL